MGINRVGEATYLPRTFVLPRDGRLVEVEVNDDDALRAVRMELELLRRIRWYLAPRRRDPLPRADRWYTDEDRGELALIVRDAEQPIVAETAALIDEASDYIRKGILMSAIHEEAENIVQEAIDSGAAQLAESGSVAEPVEPVQGDEAASVDDAMETGERIPAPVEAALAEAEAGLAEAVNLVTEALEVEAPTTDVASDQTPEAAPEMVDPQHMVDTTDIAEATEATEALAATDAGGADEPADGAESLGEAEPAGLAEVPAEMEPVGELQPADDASPVDETEPATDTSPEDAIEPAEEAGAIDQIEPVGDLGAADEMVPTEAEDEGHEPGTFETAEQPEAAADVDAMASIEEPPSHEHGAADDSVEDLAIDAIAEPQAEPVLPEPAEPSVEPEAVETSGMAEDTAASPHLAVEEYAAAPFDVAPEPEAEADEALLSASTTDAAHEVAGSSEHAVQTLGAVEEGIRTVASVLSAQVREQWEAADRVRVEMAEARSEVGALQAEAAKMLDEITRAAEEAKIARDAADVARREAKLLREDARTAKQRADASAEAAERAANEAAREVETAKRHNWTRAYSDTRLKADS